MDLIAFLETLRPGAALDLAAGNLRHAGWLAAHGWDVTAVDIATPPEIPHGVRFLCMDLEKEQPHFLGDLVVCWRYWQPDLTAVIATYVRPGGVVALAGKLAGRFATSMENYRASFAGWEELEAGDDGTFAWFIARRV